MASISQATKLKAGECGGNGRAESRERHGPRGPLALRPAMRAAAIKEGEKKRRGKIDSIHQIFMIPGKN